METTDPESLRQQAFVLEAKDGGKPIICIVSGAEVFVLADFEPNSSIGDALKFAFRLSAEGRKTSIGTCSGIDALLQAYEASSKAVTARLREKCTLQGFMCVPASAIMQDEHQRIAHLATISRALTEAGRSTGAINASAHTEIQNEANQQFFPYIPHADQALSLFAQMAGMGTVLFLGAKILQPMPNEDFTRAELTQATITLPLLVGCFAMITGERQGTHGMIHRAPIQSDIVEADGIITYAPHAALKDQLQKLLSPADWVRASELIANMATAAKRSAQKSEDPSKPRHTILAY